MFQSISAARGVRRAIYLPQIEDTVRKIYERGLLRDA